MWEIPDKMRVRYNEVCLSSWTKEKQVGLWNFKGKEGNSQEDEKEATFGKWMFAMCWGDSGTHRVLTSRLCCVPPCLPHSAHIILHLFMVIAAFFVQVLCLNTFRQLEGRTEVHPESFGLCFHLEIIHMPEWHILGCPALNPAVTLGCYRDRLPIAMYKL